MALSRSGTRVALFGRERAAETARELCASGGEAEAFDVDYRDDDAIGKTMDSVLARFGKIDLLFNGAYVVVPVDKRKRLHEFDMELYEEILAQYYHGLYRVTKAAVRDMAKRGEGAVVNIISIRGMVPVPGQTPAVAASAAAVGFTRMWGVELKETGVRVNAVAAGLAADEHASGDRQPLSHLAVPRATKPEDIAAAAMFLASDEASYITGTILPVDGGFQAGYARSF
ncbi:MAG: SDR family oxidoreductase [Phycisphaerae bacterium]|nr:SDR family oxidoreductase [Phycisphaerae bacterium]